MKKLTLNVATEGFRVMAVVRPSYYSSSRYTYRTNSGNTWNKIPSVHSHVIVPVGEYEVVDMIQTERIDGSDYCWITYSTYAVIKSKKGTDRLYQVLVSVGGDCTPIVNGVITG